jgi:hypothetical protein
MFQFATQLDTIALISVTKSWENTESTRLKMTLPETYESLWDGLPMCICGPVATPGTAPRKARKGIPCACK